MPHRRYKEYPSGNKFLCCGRLISGPDRTYFRLALTCMTIGVLAYFGLVIPYLIRYLFGIPVLIISIILVGFMVISFLITAYSDPGVIPRDENPEEDNGENKKNQTYYVKGKEVRCKFCITCQIHRPPRAIHCGICDNCVERFDHHCPWTGNCVGRNNYRHFLAFVTSLLCCVIWSFGICVIMITVSCNDQDRDFGLSVFGRFVSALISPPPANIIAAIVLGIFDIIIVGPIAFLFGFHVNILSQAITTNEYLKRSFNNGDSPYSHGFFGNWFFHYCAPDYSNYVKMREKVE